MRQGDETTAGERGEQQRRRGGALEHAGDADASREGGEAVAGCAAEHRPERGAEGARHAGAHHAHAHASKRHRAGVLYDSVKRAILADLRPGLNVTIRIARQIQAHKPLRRLLADIGIGARRYLVVFQRVL